MMPTNHRAVRETGTARVDLFYAGEVSVSGPLGRVTVELVRFGGSDTMLGRSLPYFEMSLEAARVLHATLGQFLGLKETVAQVVEVRIVHEAAPIVAAASAAPPDPERAELEEIKAGMRKGST